VKTINGDKVPGPDGFSIAFFQNLLGCFKRGCPEGFS
jgi:hypothetical protein